jgi:hypothetical protein
MRVVGLALALTFLAFALSVAGDLAGAPRRDTTERARIPSYAAEAEKSADMTSRDLDSDLEQR